MASMCGGLLKYLRDGFNMLEMTYMYEMTCIFLNGLSISEAAKICGK